MSQKFNFKKFEFTPNNLTNKVVDRNDIRRNKIVITPFEILDNYDTFMNIDYSKQEVNLKYIVMNTEAVFNILGKLNPTCTNVLIAMLANLENDTNVIRFNVAEYARTVGKSKDSLFIEFVKIFDYNIMARTNKNSTYIVNHNIFFKGDLNKFAKNYRELYKDRKVEYNNRNKVILDNKIYE